MPRKDYFSLTKANSVQEKLAKVAHVIKGKVVVTFHARESRYMLILEPNCHFGFILDGSR